MELLIRAATEADARFLAEMLGEAVAWRADEARPTVAEVLAQPTLALYVESWGRPGDYGAVAEDQGRPVGAAWYRTFTAERYGYGFVAADVPEVTVGVRIEARGRGGGTALLVELIGHAHGEGRSALSLSVEEENEPAIRLYSRLGFLRVGR